MADPTIEQVKAMRTAVLGAAAKVPGALIGLGIKSLSASYMMRCLIIVDFPKKCELVISKSKCPPPVFPAWPL